METILGWFREKVAEDITPQVPLRAVQTLLGHKRIETTLRYSHLAETHLRDAVERLTPNATDTKSDTNAERHLA
jgi:hypothetical protein